MDHNRIWLETHLRWDRPGRACLSLSLNTGRVCRPAFSWSLLIQWKCVVPVDRQLITLGFSFRHLLCLNIQPDFQVGTASLSTAAVARLQYATVCRQLLPLMVCSGCGSFLLNRRNCFVTLQAKTSNVEHRRLSKTLSLSKN